MPDLLITAFLRDNQRRNLSPHTIYDRRRLLTRYLAGVAPLTALTVDRQAIEGWLDTLPIAPRSRSSYIAALAAFHKWLMEEEHRADDPTSRIRRPKLGRLLPRPMATADLEDALALADSRMRCWLLLACLNGLRCAEIAHLRREDLFLDQDPPILRVNQGKGKKDRLVPLNPLAEAALREYGLRPGWLFTVRSGKPFAAGVLSAYVSRWMRGNGIETSLHPGRHRFGTDAYAESNGDLRLVQEMMGHSDPAVTAIYAMFDQRKAAAVVRRLGAAPVAD